MYKILLVDDEVRIRDGVSKIIKWNDLGYELIGACKDGKEAIEVIKSNRPDLVITDICMPYVNGIELAKYIYENDPSIKVIILTGYDEFEYAKLAVTYQVMEYILKPVTSSELSETLTKIRKTLDIENTRAVNINKIRSAYTAHLPVLRGRFLNQLLTTPPDAAKVSASIEEYQLDLNGPFYLTAIIEWDDLSAFSTQTDNGTSLGEFALFNVSEEIFKKHSSGEALQNIENQTVLIFSGSNANDLQELSHIVLEEIQKTCLTVLRVPTTISVGKPIHTLHKLPLSYENAKALLEYRFLLGGERIFYFSDFSGKLPELNINRMEWNEKIIYTIKSNDRDALDRLLRNFIQALRDALLPKNRIIIYIQNLILSIINVLDSTGIEISDAPNLEQNILSSIYSKKSLSELEELLHTFCNQVADAMYSEKEGYSKKQALLALDYIDKNYSNSDISLNSVCSYLAISTSYFSMIFKNYTGETFIEALTKKRIATAKELIAATSMKAYEISNAVGFADPHYFSITFKKHTGKTPTEYAKSVR